MYPALLSLKFGKAILKETQIKDIEDEEMTESPHPVNLHAGWTPDSI